MKIRRNLTKQKIAHMLHGYIKLHCDSQNKGYFHMQLKNT